MADQSPLVSVIVPAYNAEAYLARTLDSISRQTYRHIEVIVLDDGSTDGTADVVAAAARTDGRIRCVSAPNLGMAAARNAAAAEATGDALAPCDADDLWHPEKLERQVEALYGASPEAGVAYCWSHGIDEDDAVIYPGWKRAEAEGDVFQAMIMDSLLGCGSVPLIRRSCFDAVGGYPTNCGVSSNDDWRFYIALAAVCDFVVVRAHLVGYRLGTSSHSSDHARMKRMLGGTTRWVVENWPETPRHVLRCRAQTVNSYLSFLALRAGQVWMAVRYRLASLAARPSHLWSMSSLGFIYILVLQLFGIQRYYFPFWRRPAPWPGAGP